MVGLRGLFLFYLQRRPAGTVLHVKGVICNARSWRALD